MNKAQLRDIIREEIQDHLIEESITSWLLDKAQNFVKGHFNHVADYKYAAIMKSPDFQALHKKFGMNQKDFMTKAAALIKKDPKKFTDLLAFDAKKSKWAKFIRQ